jgi:hypothetical protein
MATMKGAIGHTILMAVAPATAISLDGFCVAADGGLRDPSVHWPD